MKLLRESAESGDCSGPKGEFNKLKFRAESYRDTFRSEGSIWGRKNTIIGARSGRLDKRCGLERSRQPIDISTDPEVR